MMKGPVDSVIRRQGGFALLSVLILMLVGSLIIAPMLNFMGTGITTTSLYRDKSQELYAADAGIEDARWQVKYDKVKTFGSPQFASSYSPYNFTDNWSYNLAPVNGKAVNVTIGNVWTPTPENQYDKNQAAAIINANKLVVTGSSNVGTSTYSIKLTFNPAAGESATNLRVTALGIWLPPGFTYVNGSSNLKDSSNNPLYSSESAAAYHSNVAVIWTFSSLSFDSLPGYLSQSMTATVTFRYTPATVGRSLDALSWIKTTGMYPNTQYSFDGDIRVFKLTSLARDAATTKGTVVESYVTKNELRTLDAAINGDYYATGTSLMVGTFPNYNHRDTLLATSSKDVNSGNSGIPTGANVEMAYLYWSGWVRDAANGIFWDNCGNLGSADPNYTKFNPTGSWAIDTSTSHDNAYFERFKGQGNNASLTLKSGIVDLSGVPAGQASIHWDQSAAASDLFSDPASSSNFGLLWTNGGDWGYNSNAYRGTHASGSAAARDLTLMTAQNLSGSPAATFSWDWKSDSISSSQGLDVYVTNASGAFQKVDGFLGSKGWETRTYTVPAAWLTSNFKVKFSTAGSSFSASRYVYVRNIKLNTSSLMFQISANGGAWSAPYVAMTGGRTPVSSGGSMAYDPTQGFDFVIPSSPTNYYQPNFRIKFYLSGFNGGSDYAYIDNILITDDSVVSHEDRNVTFTVETNDGTGRTFATPLTANPADTVHDKVWSKECMSGATFDGWYYAVRKDVTDFVRQHSNGSDLSNLLNPVYGNGKGTYTVGGVYAGNKSVMNYSTGKLGDASFAGWSLVIVYSSTDPIAHQLYLYEDMTSVPYMTSGGPTVITKPLTGFIVPPRIGTEADAGKLTAFVGETWPTSTILWPLSASGPTNISSGTALTAVPAHGDRLEIQRGLRPMSGMVSRGILTRRLRLEPWPRNRVSMSIPSISSGSMGGCSKAIHQER
jgi:Tfp pilus assembly protein PilX